MLRWPHGHHRDVRALQPTAGATATPAITRQDNAMTRHGTLYLQLAAILRSATPLTLETAKAVRAGFDRRRRRPVHNKRHAQARVGAGCERMILPPNPTAPASPKL